MEQIFIQKIYKITEQIISQNHDFDKTLKDLQSHLTKSRKMQSAKYEAETLNTIGILYAISGNVSQQMFYFQFALEIAYELDDIDLLIKLINNLGETYLGVWQLQEAKAILDKGIAIVKDKHMHLLGSLYIYASKIELQIREGEFHIARTYYDYVWDAAGKTDLKTYSQTEYTQIIILLNQHKFILDLVAREDSQAKSTLTLMYEQIQNANRLDFMPLHDLMLIYYTLISENDDAKSRKLEKQFIETHNSLTVEQVLQSAYFFLYNHKLDWAQRYSTMILDRAKSGQEIQENALKHAQTILEKTA